MEGWTLDPESRRQSVDSLLEHSQDLEEEGTVKLGVSGEVVRIFKPLGELSSTL